jgi:transcription antitermination factor NusG
MLTSHPEIAGSYEDPVDAAVGSGIEETPLDKMWYVISVCPRHEKQVAQLCRARSLDYLLPLYSSLRRWKDRRKLIDMVLFPGYVFVNVTLRERLGVLTLPGVVRFVTFQGQPAVVPEGEIKAIGIGTTSGVSIHPHPYLQKGRRVRIRSGSMSGMEGILVRRKDRFRVVLSIGSIMRSVAVEVDESDLEPLT